MRHRWTIIAGLILAVATATASFAGAIPETLVLGGAANQFSGDGSSTWLTWAANTPAHPRHYDALARPFAGKTSFRMNAPDTEGFAGDINGDTTEAVYQQTRRGRSSIFLYDLVARTRTAAPAAVNTDLWEWAPSVSEDQILFGRSKFTRRNSPWRIVLYDRTADTTRVLDAVAYECGCIFPGQVSDRYATWTKCLRTCQAWYYDIQAETTARIPNPQDRLQYFPAVSEDAGDLYFIRSRSGCGENVRMMRWNPIARGDAAVVSVQPPGYDVYLGPNAFDDAGGHQDVYVDRQNCGGKFYADIYVVNDADTASVPRMVVSPRPAGPVSPKRLTPPGAVPRA